MLSVNTSKQNFQLNIPRTIEALNLDDVNEWNVVEISIERFGFTSVAFVHLNYFISLIASRDAWIKCLPLRLKVAILSILLT